MSGGYGQVSDQGGDVRKKKRVAIITVSSLVLVAMVVAVAVGVSHNKPESGSSNAGQAPGEISKSMKAIKTICQPAEYKEVCEKSLSSVAGNTTDPKELVKAGFQVAVKYISEALNKSTVLQELEKDKRTSMALENCKEMAQYAIEDLEQSVEELGEFDLSKVDDLLMNIKVWLSAALTFQETCKDGFENTTGTAGESMKKALKTAGEITANGLNIVTEISSVLTTLNIPLNRRLLSTPTEANHHRKLAEDGLPTWASSGSRRLLALPKNKIVPNVVVAKDGSGKYKTITEALKDIPLESKPKAGKGKATIHPKTVNTTFIIYVKAGVYQEYVTFERKMANVMLIGDGPLKTRITGNKNFADGTPTSKTATVVVLGDNFICKDIGFENTAGPEKHQAVALRSQANRAIFHNCHMDGYQDTLYVQTYLQFYSQCTITGTIDFIFGNAEAVFQDCKMIVRKPSHNQQNIVTAQGRVKKDELGAIVIQNSVISADPLLLPEIAKFPTYLGRPWKEFSTTIIMNTQIDSLIRPEGWLEWQGLPQYSNTLFYAEFNNRGPGADLSKRVKWKGIKTPISKETALSFTPRTYLKSDTWLPASGVPFIPGL